MEKVGSGPRKVLEQHLTMDVHVVITCCEKGELSMAKDEEKEIAEVEKAIPYEDIQRLLETEMEERTNGVEYLVVNLEAYPSFLHEPNVYLWIQVFLQIIWKSVRLNM
ncbi:hypothetical protein SUGI_0665300 [Cryptomeria japonica]|nr:hypothetical protein SUGI_0665300 [Cryptomeria japonica]